MPIAVAGVPSSKKRPGGYFNVIIGGSGTSAGAAPVYGLLYANMIATALSGASPSFSVAAGTEVSAGAAIEQPKQCFGTDEAATKYGFASEAHVGAKAFFDQYPDGTLFICPVAEGGGATKASGTLTLAGTATAGGTLRVVVAGRVFDIGVTTGQAATGALASGSLSEAVCAAINTSATPVPVTAQYVTGTGVTTATFRHGGTRGNSCTFRAYWITSTGLVPISTSTTQFGITASISGSGKLASGATADNVTNALAATSTARYHRQACAHDDTTNINRIRDAMATKAGATSMLWEQLSAGFVGSPSAAQTAALAINHERVQLVPAENNDALTVEIAAQAMAGRLNGDAVVVSNASVGEAADPSANLNGIELKSIRAPASRDDYPTATEVESMLNNGCAPLDVSVAHPGYMYLVASYTTKHKDGNGAFNYAAAETKVVTVTDYVAETVRDDLLGRYKGYKLAPDTPNDEPVEIPRVVTPRDIRDRILDKLHEIEGDGIITGVDALADELVVEIDGSNNQRVNIELPEFPIPNLSIFAANVRQRSL
jgi:phage tail sheath gpL-like